MEKDKNIIKRINFPFKIISAKIYFAPQILGVMITKAR